MLKISKQQLYTRLDVLPQNLKDVLFSPDTADIVWNICRSEHLSDEKSSVVAQLAGDVLMGFVHREDLDKEIQKETGVDIKIAQAVAAQADKRIFSGLQAEIDGVYSPVAVAHPLPDVSGPEPVMIADNEPDVVDLKSPTANRQPTTDNQVAPVENLGTSPSPVLEEKKESGADSQQPIVDSNLVATEAAPLMLHKLEDADAIKQKRASLGGLLGIFRKNSSDIESRRSTRPDTGVIADVIVAGHGRESAKAVKQAAPEFKIINYSQVADDPQPTMDSPMREGATIQAAPTSSENHSGLSKPLIDNEKTVLPDKPAPREKDPAAISGPTSKEDVVVPKTVRFDELPNRPLTEDVAPQIDLRPISDPISAVDKNIADQNNITAQNNKTKPEDIRLKDIPVKDDVIDLRNI